MVGTCDFDYPRLLTVGVCEWIGVLVVQLLVDRAWTGPWRWLCGRRGTQVTMYALSALFGFLLGFPKELGPDGLLICAMISRASITAANSAMWIAAPEMYPTRARAIGANIAFLINLLGSLPASAWVTSGKPQVRRVDAQI